MTQLHHISTYRDELEEKRAKVLCSEKYQRWRTWLHRQAQKIQNKGILEARQNAETINNTQLFRW